MPHMNRYLREFNDIQGWFGNDSVAVWDSLLDHQRAVSVAGHLLEIGVWKGRSAALMALHSSSEETCVLVDCKPMDEARSRIETTLPDAKCLYMVQSSETIIHSLHARNITGAFRWVHIDGEHTAEAVTRDLSTADALLRREGLLVIDDFFSPQYPQITLAVFQYLFTHPSRFVLFLCGFNKAYLCRPLVVQRYLEFVKGRLADELANRGVHDVTLWKTTEPADMNTFGIATSYEPRKYRGPDWNKDVIHI